MRDMVPLCLFVSDLHGKVDRYRKLFSIIAAESPDAVFLGGDLLPHEMAALSSPEIHLHDFVNAFLAREFETLKKSLGHNYPRIFVILGNDDGRIEEPAMIEVAARGIWEYAHGRKIAWNSYMVYGYSYVPPTPFLRKDWERYDVSRYVDPHAISPEEGWRTYPVSDHEKRFMTIAGDLETLTGSDNLAKAIMLFHTPPYKTRLDISFNEQRMYDGAPLDPHLGSIAVRRLIENRQPRITLHGHIHESPRISGFWNDRIGETYIFSACHDGPELALIRFDPDHPETATRELL